MRRGFTNRAQPLPDLDEFCLNLAKSIVDDPGGLKVASVEGSQLSVIELDAPPEEIGRVVGRDGRTIAAIRTLAEALAMRLNRRVMVDVQVVGGAGRRP
jgi:predicted RNA-binding protein YlqC (UPF0109 family)